MAAEKLGHRLKRLRERAGLTQQELADAAGVPLGTLRNVEYDRREPLLGLAGKLARALGVSLDTLAGMDEPAPGPKRRGRK
jgi:transcriptional regulator with XRE-family HTH domain